MKLKFEMYIKKFQYYQKASCVKTFKRRFFLLSLINLCAITYTHYSRELCARTRTVIVDKNSTQIRLNILNRISGTHEYNKTVVLKMSYLFFSPRYRSSKSAVIFNSAHKLRAHNFRR